MKRVLRDRNGVPVLSSVEVQELAERFLSRMAPECLQRPLFTPLAEIMGKLQEGDFVRFDLSRNLGQSPDGHKYLGWYDLDSKVISIDQGLLADDIRFPFTVAHELGHFYLHGPVRRSVLQSDGIIRDTARHLLLARIESDNPRSLLEWQANQFAGAVLIPRATVGEAVIQAQNALGVTQNRGHVWLDDSPTSRRDYRLLVQKVAATYQTSHAVVRIRLHELSIVQQRTIGPPAHAVSGLIQNALREIFGDANL